MGNVWHDVMKMDDTYVRTGQYKRIIAINTHYYVLQRLIQLSGKLAVRPNKSAAVCRC